MHFRDRFKRHAAQVFIQTTGWGAEVRQDITATETVLCATATYAGTNSGKIYKKMPLRPMRSIIPAIDPSIRLSARRHRQSRRFYREHSGLWRNDTLGTGNYICEFH